MNGDLPDVAVHVVRPMIVHVIDNPLPGGAQEIVRCLAVYGPNGRVVSVFGNDSFHPKLQAAGVKWAALADKKRHLPFAVARLFGLVSSLPKNTIVNAHLDFSTLALCALRRVMDFRLVVTVHALQSQWPRWYVPLFRMSIGAADHVVVEDRISREEVAECGVPRRKITLIPIGTDAVDQPARPPDIDIRRTLGIPGDAPIFLNIARMVPAKGQAHLVKALSLARRVEAVAIIIGYGPEAAKLRVLAEDLGVSNRVFFAGARTDLYNIYPVATALVMPCLDESMGVVVYEALSYGVPVLAYNSGSIGEIIADSVNGFLIKTNPAALAARMDDLIQRKPMFDFSKISEHSARTMCERYAGVYAALGGSCR